MISKSNVSIIIFLLIAVALFASVEEEQAHHFDWYGFFGSVINAVILFGGLIYLLRKPIGELLYKRTLEVKTDIINRDKNLEKTSNQLKELQNRIDKIEREVQQIKDISRKKGEDEVKRIEELGKNECEKIKLLTKKEIDVRIESSIRRLKSKIADLTVEHFKKDIISELNDKSHDKIIEKNIEISGEIIERE